MIETVLNVLAIAGGVWFLASVERSLSTIATAMKFFVMVLANEKGYKPKDDAES